MLVIGRQSHALCLLCWTTLVAASAVPCCCCRARSQAALVEGFINKVPKVVVGALDATLTLIR